MYKSFDDAVKLCNCLILYHSTERILDFPPSPIGRIAHSTIYCVQMSDVHGATWNRYRVRSDTWIPFPSHETGILDAAHEWDQCKTELHGKWEPLWKRRNMSTLWPWPCNAWQLLLHYVLLYRVNDHLCGLVVRVFGYRSGGPGSISGTTRIKSSGSGTGSTQLREYNWGATW
jgi:hypothetical protein